MSRSQIVRIEGMKDTVVVSENSAWAKGLWLRKQSEAGGTELDITFLRGRSPQLPTSRSTSRRLVLGLP
jgi:hypothetical protein